MSDYSVDEDNFLYIPLQPIFNISNRLTADSMMPYVIDGKIVTRKVSYVINHDPLFVWDKLYGHSSKLSFAKCAHSKLMQVIKLKHPHLYTEKENKKLRHKAKHNIKS
jgi:hypothetical protein